jgi:hypothetical protein
MRNARFFGTDRTKSFNTEAKENDRRPQRRADRTTTAKANSRSLRKAGLTEEQRRLGMTRKRT